jgi:hypothetical protein
MEVLPIDLTAIFGILMGCSIFLIPIAGWTARFALKPLVEAIVQARGGGARQEALVQLQQRVEQLEAQLRILERGEPRMGQRGSEQAALDGQSAAPVARLTSGG